MLSRRVLICVLAAGNLFSSAQEKSESQYAKLVAQVKAGAAMVDFKQMRLSYMDSPEYRAAKDTEADAEAMIGAINANDFPAAIKNADVVLASDYVDLDAHFAEYIAHRELHHDAEAKFRKDVFDGLLRSITASGDGKSEQTAFVVISTHEEYVVLRVAGLVLDKQSLKHVNHHSYDVIEATDEKSKQNVALYFNVDVPMKHCK
jgi:hypothetical protein